MELSERKTWENQHERLHLSGSQRHHPVDPSAAAAMKNIMEEEFGNPPAGIFSAQEQNKKLSRRERRLQTSFTPTAKKLSLPPEEVSPTTPSSKESSI